MFILLPLEFSDVDTAGEFPFFNGGSPIGPKGAWFPRTIEVEDFCVAMVDGNGGVGASSVT